MNDDIAKALGFANAAEFHRMVASVDIAEPGRAAAFKRWQDEDGSKDGLLSFARTVQPSQPWPR